MASEIIVRDNRGGGTLETGDFERASQEAGKPESGVFRSVFLIVGGFMGLVDDDETEIFDWGEEGRTGADNDLRGFC